MPKLYTADFETTTDENDCRVWAWGVCDIYDTDNFVYGNSIESFFEFIEKEKNASFYIHNVKFDGEFMFHYLFTHGFKHVKTRKEEASKTFTTLISDLGLFYSIKVIFSKQNKRSKYANIYDSLKILPFSVEEIAKAFGLPMEKLKLDYDSYRAIGHELTQHEVDYLRNDVVIVAHALRVLFDQNLDRMTQGSNALYDYKNTVGQKNFERWFPVPYYDKDVRQAYKGGFTYLSKHFKNKDIGTGLVFDVNSLYPWVLHDCKLPYGEGVYFQGRYRPDDLYDVYVQMFTCQFELKEGYIPTIQLKDNLAFIPNEYVESSNGEEVTMCLTSIDLELFLEHYNIYNEVWHSGWKFKSTVGLFTEYIDKWMNVKIQATIEGNKAMRALSKLMLNALYGKFATSTKAKSKFPYLGEDGIIHYEMGEEEEKQPIYIPVGAFVTAYARYKTISTAQKLGALFAYADTDSCHISIDLPESILNMSEKEIEKLTTKELLKHGVKLPEGFDVDPVALGAWKCESKFYRARFIRQKTYVEDWNTPDTWNKPEFSTSKVKEECEEKGLDFNEEIKKYKGMYDKDLLNITCAGMPSKCYQYVNWDNFYEGQSFKGKLQPKHVKGGIVLKDTIFTIKYS